MPIENTAPYFEEWDDLMPIELTLGDDEQFVFKLPEVFDDDFDSITIKVKLS